METLIQHFPLALEIGLLAGIFHRLGNFGARLDNHAERLENHETRIGNLEHETLS